MGQRSPKGQGCSDQLQVAVPYCTSDSYSVLVGNISVCLNYLQMSIFVVMRLNRLITK